MKLDAAVRAYKSVSRESRTIVGRHVRGKIVGDDYQAIVDELRKAGILEEHWDEDEVVEFTLPMEESGLFAHSLTDLMVAPSRKVSVYQRFYIADIDLLYPDQDSSGYDELNRYIQAATLASSLKKVADHYVYSPPQVIFLHGEKIALPIAYGREDLVDLPDLEGFIETFVEAKLHKDQKVTIIKATLLELLKTQDQRRLDFPFLLTNFREFYERVKANYQLYVSEFSFEKIKEQVEQEKYEITLKLNKVFSDIQNQLLAVPIALILAGGQMQPGGGYLRNIAIWCGVVIFGVFMSMLVRNQRATLGAVRNELDSQWKYIAEKHLDINNYLQDHYKSLIHRYYHQQLFLMVVSFFVSSAVVATTGLLVYYSDAAERFFETWPWMLMGVIGYFSLCFFWPRGWEKLYSRMKVTPPSKLPDSKD